MFTVLADFSIDENDFENCQYEGWLLVCEEHIKQMPHSSSQRFPTEIRWHPGYCIARTDQHSMICYDNEQVVQRSARQLKRFRIDGGLRSFWKYWKVNSPNTSFEDIDYSNPSYKAMPGYHGDVGSNYNLKEETIDKLRTDKLVNTLPFRTSNKKFLKQSCFDGINDGTESLGRRGWHQRQLNRANRCVPSNGHMTSSLIHPDNSYYQDGQGVAIVDSPTAPQRFANFLSRQFRSNPLKRTKSASKLDQKRIYTGDSECNSRADTQRSQENISALGSSSHEDTLSSRRQFSQTEDNSLRSYRSHESLLNYSNASHVINLGTADPRVVPVHQSVLDMPNCFRIKNTYYACRTQTERNRWMEGLRRAANPQRDRMRRTENSFEIWILEAKGVPIKRKYYCEICLDKILYARTSAKSRGDICFWGEHFDFSPVPKLEVVCVNLYREADSKKKKDRSTLIGYVQIKIDDLTTRHPVERWYTVTGSSDGGKFSSKDKSDAAALRVKARYQSVEILPLHMYDELLRFLRYRYFSLCTTLEPLLGVKAKEDLATTLVRIMYNQRLAKEFLCDLIMSEIEALDNEHLMFRGNSLATKAMEAYMKLVAEQYLQETLGDFVKSILESDDSCEVDPMKMPNINPNILEKNRQQLISNVEMAWRKIINSINNFPYELREIFDSLRQQIERANRQELADTLISSSIFLRFLCPAILSPSLFNLVSEYPSGKAARNLTLIAKTLQTLANFTKFGGKEHYMEFMNNFVEREWDSMHYYLMCISSVTPSSTKRIYAPHIDLGKELSLLHSHLAEIWTKQIHEKVSSANEEVDELHMILSRLSVLLNGGSNFDYDGVNLPNSTSDYDNNLLRSRNHNSTFSHIMSRSTPATHLGTNDDYVLDIALLNDSLTMRKAGMCVQQHRNGQNKSCRSSTVRSALENSRDLLSSHDIAYDEKAYSTDRNGVSGKEFDIDKPVLSIPRTNIKVNDTTGVDCRVDDSDSDEDNDLKQRQLRPTRKNKRRIKGVLDQNENIASNIAMNAPSSSGYQSQEHSNSLSSSNSSSPIDRVSDRSLSLDKNSSRQVLQISNPMYQNTANLLSINSPRKLNKDKCDTSEHSIIPSSSEHAYNRISISSKEGASVPEICKSSLPRTNPRVNSRSIHGTYPNINVIKPTLIDIGTEETLVHSKISAKIPANTYADGAKENGTSWSEKEQFSEPQERWQDCRLNGSNTQQNQLEIIELQKREILRLMRENEELKRHVAAQECVKRNLSSSTRISDKHTFADSGASEASYDSYSSLNEVTSNLAEKRTNHS